MAYKIDPLDAELCDICGATTFAWVQPCKDCQRTDRTLRELREERVEVKE